MSDELDLRNALKDHMQSKENQDNVKEALKQMLNSENPDKEKLEILENILSKSNVQFASVADKVSVDFAKFVNLIKTHDVAPLMDAMEKKQKAEMAKGGIAVVVSSDLLTDISNCAKVEEEEESVNVLSGIFIYGLFVGFILSLATAIILKFVNFHMSIRDLVLILGGSIVFVSLPILLIVFEPYLKNIQKKHNEFFVRVVGFFSGK